ncbi:hypothetical protein [Rhodohalobacter sulfatireducens]|uniref:Uncharacterized protein n=1 Tax=Rhodohalobacter sulfatireducens TaxID=2911366 RepID=A0ABS9KAD8_9BACT|nr:hypothetical protein [Rhodohalobacter sulfatireducens]MCG2587814.1 hypothetical protein [Rhodohalobacter sulfatireducens]
MGKKVLALRSSEVSERRSGPGTPTHEASEIKGDLNREALLRNINARIEIRRIQIA